MTWADHGIQVRLSVRDAEAGEALARGIGRGARLVLMDLDRPETLASALKATSSADTPVNNAGLAHVAPTSEDPKGFGTQMRVMVHSPYERIQLYALGMIRREWRWIVNVSSTAGSSGTGLPGPNAYGVAEAALNALALALSGQVPSSVKINAICPG